MEPAQGNSSPNPISIIIWLNISRLIVLFKITKYIVE